MRDDLYQLLDVDERASAAELRKAFKQLAFRYHPDRNPDPAAAAQFRLIREAYDVLSDPARRRAYDYFRHMPAPAPAPPPPPPEVVYEVARQRWQREVAAADTLRNRLRAVALVLGLLLTVAAVARAPAFFAKPANQLAFRHYVLRQDSADFLTRAQRAQATAAWAEAAFYYRGAIRYAHTPRAAWYYAHGQCLARLSLPYQAMASFEQAATLAPDYDSAYHALGDLATYQLQEYARGEVYFTQAIALNPSYHAAWFGRAYGRLKRQQYVAALTDWHRLATLTDALDATYWYYRGFTYWELKRPVEACRDWQRAEKMDYAPAHEARRAYCSTQQAGN